MTTTYEVWQHVVTEECWVVRIELDGVSGLAGPFVRGHVSSDPEALMYEEHPDDLEWLIRSSDSFRVLGRQT